MFEKLKAKYRRMIGILFAHHTLYGLLALITLASVLEKGLMALPVAAIYLALAARDL